MHTAAGTPPRRPAAQAAGEGIALLEVAVALALLSGGVLGWLWWQQAVHTQQRQQLAHANALTLAHDLAERMALNGSARLHYRLDWAGTSSPVRVSASADCTTQPCTPTQLAAWDLQQWGQRVRAELPLGDASVFPASAPEGWWGVVLAWHDPAQSLRTDDTAGTPACPSEKSCWRLWVSP